MSQPPNHLPPVLVVRDLCKYFGGVKALDGIDLHVAPGELLGVIGPNGAGKTALINTITGFYRATSGCVELQGQEVSHLPMHQIGRLGIGRTFQNIRLFKRMTVLENVLVAFKQFSKSPFLSFFRNGTPKADITSAMNWLEQLQLADHANDLAGSLSYGDARRLEIARALAGNPQLLLLDEPAAGMNDAETEQLTQDIRKIRQHVSSILLIEHDMGVIRALSDRVVAMDYGKKIAEGTAREVLEHPEVLRAYLGGDEEDEVRT
ncbi:ABC transporter ATP-binding protein [Tepidicella baoligensis]|uniref:ABC transporter ATP-binding protein n=1 Tax=Tepidicella baoligensis TaxID=2707016 RepID=UPI0015DB341E|nr:ABC transporter ATP-binding protein [Tepidicella baoligensis]